MLEPPIHKLKKNYQLIGQEYVLEYEPYEPLDHVGEIHFQLTIWAAHKDRILPFSECLRQVHLK